MAPEVAIEALQESVESIACLETKRILAFYCTSLQLEIH